MSVSRIRGVGFVAGLLSFFTSGGASYSQTPFLTYDFEDGNFDDFFNPTGQTAIKFCNPADVPSGEAVVDAGEVLMTNDPNARFGLCLLVMRPGTVSGKFPAGPRNGRTPPAPGPNACGLDVNADAFAQCVYSPAGPGVCGG